MRFFNKCMSLVLFTILFGFYQHKFVNVQAQLLQEPITTSTTIRVWFVNKNLNGNPIWKGGVVGVFDPIPSTPELPNPRPISFEEDYLPSVVGTEIQYTGDALYLDSSLQGSMTQAIVARTYALYKINNREPYCYDADETKVCDVTDSTAHQHYNPANKNNILSVRAVNNTYPTYIIQDGDINPIFSEYSKDHCGLYTTQGSYVYTLSIYDPITKGETNNCGGNTPPLGHGRGVSQVGTKYWSIGRNLNGVPYPTWDYTRILAHYYTGVQLRHGVNGDLYWGRYRWNMLDGYINPFMYAGHPYRYEYLIVQNTGMESWRAGTYLYYYVKRTNKEKPWDVKYSTRYQGPLMPQVTPGHHAFITPFNIIPPLDIYKDTIDGSVYTYELIFDLRQATGGYFQDGETGFPGRWLPQYVPMNLKYPVSTVEPCKPENCPPSAMNINTVTLNWTPIYHPDGIIYHWKRKHGTSTKAQGTTHVPTLEHTPLDRGLNTFTIQPVQVNDATNMGATTAFATVHYDPDPSTLVLDVQPWVRPGQTVDVGFVIDDSVLGSGIKAYSLKQHNPDGSMSIIATQSDLVDTVTLPQTTVSASIQLGLLHGQATTWELTTIDYAGNVVSMNTTAHIDAQAPLLTQSNHPMWTNQTTVLVQWVVEDAESGVQQVRVEFRQAGGTWAPVQTWSYAAPYLAQAAETVTLTGLTEEAVYEVRYTLVDALGNQTTATTTIKTDVTAPYATIPDISDPGDTTIYIPEAWTDLVVSGGDASKTSHASGVAYYAVRYGTVDLFGRVKWYGTRYIGHLGNQTLRFKAPANARYVFAVQARDWAGNLSGWSAPTLPYQFGTGYAGYYEGYSEVYLPLFRPTVRPFPSGLPATDISERHGIGNPYPLREN